MNAANYEYKRCDVQSSHEIICIAAQLGDDENRHFIIPKENIIPKINDDEILTQDLKGDYPLWRKPYQCEGVN